MKWVRVDAFALLVAHRRIRHAKRQRVATVDDASELFLIFRANQVDVGVRAFCASIGDRKLIRRVAKCPSRLRQDFLVGQRIGAFGDAGTSG